MESLRKEPDAPPKKRAAAIQLMNQLLRVQLLKVTPRPPLIIFSPANKAERTSLSVTMQDLVDALTVRHSM